MPLWVYKQHQQHFLHLLAAEMDPSHPEPISQDTVNERKGKRKFKNKTNNCFYVVQSWCWQIYHKVRQWNKEKLRDLLQQLPKFATYFIVWFKFKRRSKKTFPKFSDNLANKWMIQVSWSLSKDIMVSSISALNMYFQHGITQEIRENHVHLSYLIPQSAELTLCAISNNHRK